LITELEFRATLKRYIIRQILKKLAKQKKILIAPLNWGLGHATRCMPIINELLVQGADVQLASDGVALDLSKKEYPQLLCHELPSYDIRYPFDSMVLSMAAQSPKILRGCVKEHIWLKKFLQNNKIDIVISDNRFGFFNKNVKSIFMTHQLNIQAPFRPIVDFINAFFIKKFNECWIPDFDGEPNIAGSLSHGGLANSLIVKYLGSLSRMKKLKVEKKYKAIFVLSGPEPQRTIFEKKILEQLSRLEIETEASPPTPSTRGGQRPQYILIKGQPNSTQSIEKYKNIEIHNFMTASDLNIKILESEVLVARSGYSTIMDLVNLGSPAVLIPTPGQTEQEYLADNLMQKGVFYTQKQADLDITRALEAVKKYPGFGIFNGEKETFKEIISDLLKN
jgi:Glycosyltransferase family 28 C-terminal domain